MPTGGHISEATPTDANGQPGATRRHAGLLRRVGAMCYDALLVVALWLVTLFPIVALSNSAVTGATVRSLLFIELFVFFAYFWVSRGQTLGMLAWRLRLVPAAPGEPVTLRQALLRFIGALAAFATLGLGYLWMYIDPERRTWPDMLSGTRVIHEPR
ncbi:MAG TPA: RDD family protein [Pseudomonadales bacterium]